MTRRRKVLIALAAGALGAPFASLAQQTTRKVYRVGYLASTDPGKTPHIEALRAGLRERGHVEGQSYLLDVRWTEGSTERLPELAAELARRKVDVIVAWGTPAVTAARRAAPTLPIVFAGVGDPVGSGFVSTLAQPGGNITGITNLAGDLTGKLLELLAQVVPDGKRFGVLRNPANALALRQMNVAETAARALARELQVADVRVPGDFENAYAGLAKTRVAGAILFADPMLAGNPGRLAELAIKHRIPSISMTPDYPVAGGLMSYGANLSDQWRHAASHVDRILKGAKPGDLPVEQPTKFDLTVNLKTAKALGVTIPQSILVRADRVIE